MLILHSDRTECRWQQSLAIASDSGLLMAVAERFSCAEVKERSLAAHRSAPSPPDGDVYPLDGAQGTLPVELPGTGGEGIGLGSSAPACRSWSQWRPALR